MANEVISPEILLYLDWILALHASHVFTKHFQYFLHMVTPGKRVKARYVHAKQFVQKKKKKRHAYTHREKRLTSSPSVAVT